MGTLFVRNAAQVILFKEFLVGQISDGLWENTKPNDHWEAWADAEVVVGGVDVIGRDFSVVKDNYQLNDKRILDIFADEMVAKVRELTSADYSREWLLGDLRDLKKIFKTRVEVQSTPLQSELADPSLSLCALGRDCPDYSGSAPRHAVSLHGASVTMLPTSVPATPGELFAPRGEWKRDGNGGWKPANETARAIARAKQDLDQVRQNLDAAKAEFDQAGV